MADITAKIRLDGEANFTRHINNAKKATKALDDELALAEDQFKRTGDKETYMKEKGRLLKSQIEQQRSAVDKAKEALEQCAKQGLAPNATKTMEWRGKLAQAQKKLNLLNDELANNEKGLDASGKSYDELAKSIGAADEKGGSFGSTLDSINKQVSLSNVSDALKSVNDTIDRGIQKAVSFGRALWDMTSDSTEWADDLATKAKQSGIDAKTLQQWEYAARFVDTDVDAIIAARTRLVSSMGKGTGKDELLESLGVSVTDAEGGLRDVNDVMWDAIEAISKMGDGTEKEQAAMELFGRGYKEMIPLLDAGREEWDAWANKAPVVSDKDLEKLTSANDALEDLDANLQNTKRTLLAQLAPALESVAGSLTNALQELGRFLETEEGQAKMQAFSDAVVKLAQNIFDIDWSKTIEGVGKAFDAITGALTWIIDNKELVAAAFTTIFAAKLFTTLSTAATNMGRLWEGLKNVLGITGGPTLGGGAGATGTGSGVGQAAAGGVLVKGAGGITTTTAVAGGAAITAVGMAAGVGIAELGQRETLKAWEDEKEAAEEATAALKATEGATETVQFLEKALEATGPQRDGNGGWQKGVFGWWTNFNTTGQSRDVLMGLQDRKNMQMAELYETVKGKTVQGYDVWTLLNALWNPRYGKEDYEEDWALDDGILDETLDAIRDAYIAKGMQEPREFRPKEEATAPAVTEGAAHDLLMGLSWRKGAQLADLQRAVIGAGGQDAWNQLMRLWKQDNLTESEVQELYRVLTQADSTIIETAARKAAEDAEEAVRQTTLQKLMGLQSRTGQQRAQMFAGLNEQQQAMLSGLWNGGTLNATDALALYGAIFGVNGVNLTRPGGSGAYGQEGIDADEMAGIMASALSQAAVDMDGKSVGRIVAPYVSEILARQMNDRW